MRRLKYKGGQNRSPDSIALAVCCRPGSVSVCLWSALPGIYSAGAVLYDAGRHLRNFYGMMAEGGSGWIRKVAG